ncbi:MAG: DUF1326 domain-containing protein [SAR324 cluster bacterium]|nr:DUF1326 domain-containing protein [SAR324 cluster bacterium]
MEGSLLEVCNCNVLCPCWIGVDPDNGTCDSVLAHNYDKGEINGIDVSGLTIAFAVHIPGNVLEGNWKAMVYIDDNASKEQEEMLLSVYTGKEGGPIVDLVSLIGEVVGVERAPITFTVKEGKGTLRIGEVADCEMEPFVGPNGDVTTLHESIFSTIPGSPAYIAKAIKYKSNNPAVGHSIDLKDTNAIQGKFVFATA